MMGYSCLWFSKQATLIPSSILFLGSSEEIRISLPTSKKHKRSSSKTAKRTLKPIQAQKPKRKNSNKEKNKLKKSEKNKKKNLQRKIKIIHHNQLNKSPKLSKKEQKMIKNKKLKRKSKHQLVMEVELINISGPKLLK